jgi:hypothetical protein
VSLKVKDASIEIAQGWQNKRPAQPDLLGLSDDESSVRRFNEGDIQAELKRYASV